MLKLGFCGSPFGGSDITVEGTMSRVACMKDKETKGQRDDEARV